MKAYKPLPGLILLTGKGYALSIAPEAQARKQSLLGASGAITRVSSLDESADARFVCARLSEMRIEVEKCRKAIKEPVLATGKEIDQLARDFLAELDAEEKRLRILIGDHYQEQERIRQEKEAAEREAFDKARAAREAAQAATDRANASQAPDDIKAAADAALENRLAISNKLAASAEVIAAAPPGGVRMVWDFEIKDIAHVYAAAPGWVELTPRRAEILAWIRQAAEVADDQKLIDKLAEVGITAFKRPVVSTR